jgi:hypothetical protein
MISVAVERLMELEVGVLTAAAYDEKNPKRRRLSQGGMCWGGTAEGCA